MLPLVTLLLIAVPMLLETRRSRANERALRAAGAIEPPDDVYPVMQIVYPTIFVVMIVEGALRQVTWGAGTAAVGLVVFVLAKALKYAAIATLGPRWTFRVLVPPGSVPTRRGVYRWLRHPNYVGVMGEIIGIALMMSALVAGLVSSVLFAVILWRRVVVEEQALGEVGEG
jgi:methyltransferase